MADTTERGPTVPTGPPRNILFVAGVARSGTTALVEMLDRHPDLALGVERYKRLWRGRLAELTPALFEQERFFDFADGLTNISPELPRWRGLYDDLAARWEDAAYVGDKMTLVAPIRVWRSIPQARFLFIVRDPAEVAASWNVRAANALDRWPDAADARRSVDIGNAAYRRMGRAARQRPRDVCVVGFRDLFADPDGRQLARILDFLELDPSPALETAFAAAHRDYQTVAAPKERSLTSSEQAFLTEHLDHRAWQDVCSLSDQLTFDRPRAGRHEGGGPR